MPRGENADDPIGTFDFETDPFLIGRIPFPFAACIFFAREDYGVLWKSDSNQDFIARVMRALRRLPKCTLYAHNGGRFDFHYLLESAEPQILQVRNGRVTKMRIGKVTLKDSFPLMPFALEEYRKTKINYAIFKKEKRDQPDNRKRITDYLIDDCANLLELVTGFRKVVGPRDTIGSAAFYNMRQMGLDIQSLNETHDSMFRPYYYGGRVEAFKKGIHDGRYIYLDINSAYSFAMLSSHAHGSDYIHSRTLPRVSDLGNQFIHCIAESRGALPMRSDTGDLLFPHDRGEFFATGWEIAAGIKTKTLRIDRVLDIWKPQSLINFSEYVKTFFARRLRAKKQSDKIGSIAYKYLLNSGYGKFAQNPRDFKTYCIAPLGRDVPGFNWETDFGAISLWSKPAFHGWGFFDVATAASITGYVRAMLWQAICSSRDVLYCDTDCIICRSSSVPLGDRLGQWKCEHAPGVYVKRAAIAGKKLYGVEWSRSDDRGAAHKIASKGARLTFREILDLCRGKHVIWTNPAPTFSLGNIHFIRREIQST